MQRINHFISVSSALLVLFLAGSAFFLSFESLKDLAVQIGVAEPIAWLYPAIIDGAIIVFSLSVLRANLTQERTIYPWVLVCLFTLLSVVLNPCPANTTCPVSSRNSANLFVSFF